MDSIESTCQYTMSRQETIGQLWRLWVKPSMAIGMLALLVGGLAAVVALRPAPLSAYGLVLLPVFFYFFMWRTVHRAVAQHPQLLETQTLRFGAAGFSVTNSLGTLEWPWARVRSVAESDTFVILRLDTIGSGAVVPKRAFTAEQLAAFLAYANHAGPRG
jgi:hypothetical protein